MSAGDGALPAAADVRAAVERVLSRPEFQVAEQGRLERFLEWLGDRLGELSEWIDDLLGSLGGGGVLQWLLVAWLVLSLLAVLGHLVWSLRAGTRRAPAAGAAADGGAGRPAAELLAAAEEAAAAGRLEQAMHLLYLGALSALDAQGRLHFLEGKAGGEYLAELGGAARAGWRRLLAAFYPVAFGGRPASAAGWASMRAAAAETGALSGGGPR